MTSNEALNPYARFIENRAPIEIISATAESLSRALAKTSDSQWRQRPRPDKWSLAEIVSHLADTEIVFAFRLRQTIAEEQHTCQPFDQDKWAKTYSSADYRDAMETFIALRKWNVQFIRALPETAFAKPFMHPERGEMTFALLVETMAGHDLNHLEQIKMLAKQ